MVFILECNKCGSYNEIEPENIFKHVECNECSEYIYDKVWNVGEYYVQEDIFLLTGKEFNRITDRDGAPERKVKPSRNRKS